MRKFFYDTSLNSKLIGGVRKTIFFLFEAIAKVAPDCEIIGVQRKNATCEIPQNVTTKIRKFPYESTLWRNTVYPFYAMKNPDVPFYFPVNGNIPTYMPYSTPIITTIHDVLPLEIPNYFENIKEEKKYTRKLQSDIHKSDLIFVISEYTKKKLCENFVLDIEPVVLPNASTIDKKFVDLPLQKFDETYFLYNGRYDKRKGLDALLKVFIYLHTTKKLRSKLYITGNHQFISEEFEINFNIAKELGIIKEVGYVTEQQMAVLLKNAVAMLYPSKYEGFGLPPLEAMRMSCPVVVENMTALPEVCGDAALYVDVNDIENYSRALIMLENDESLRQNLIARGLNQEAKFSWEKSAQIFIENLEKLTSEEE